VVLIERVKRAVTQLRRCRYVLPYSQLRCQLERGHGKRRGVVHSPHRNGVFHSAR
jgi:hypothetical protein